MLVLHKDKNPGSQTLQDHLHKIEQWLKKWRVVEKMAYHTNETKSIQ